MANEEDNEMYNPLSDYPSCLAFYRGEGTLTLNDQQIIPCMFKVGQLRKGSVFLVCDAPTFDAFFFMTTQQFIERFDGVTVEGFHISTVGNILLKRASGGQLACWLQALSVDIVKDVLPYKIHYGITNFVFDAPFSLNLEHDGITTAISAEPVEHHSKVITRVQDLQSIDVTCEIAISIHKTEGIANLDQIVNNLCYLLSIAQGTKVQWIYRSLYEETGTCLSRVHASKVAKVYGPLSLLTSDRDIQTFVEGTYSTYVMKREHYRLDMGTIDTYLDAKAENDYLQVRGIKLAVTMEVIKDVFTSLPDSPVEKFILSKDKQKRRKFADILDDIFKRIHLQLDPEDRRHFIECRNSLIHQGRFYCETTNQETSNKEPLIQEHYFLVNILDKVFLKLLGYHGSYWDRSVPRQPIYKLHV